MQVAGLALDHGSPETEPKQLLALFMPKASEQ